MKSKFKKRVSAALLAMVIGAGSFAAITFAACDNSGKGPDNNPGNEQTEFYVSFDMQTHGVQIDEAQTSGGKVTKPADPTAKGYVFGGWYTNKECTKEFKFDTAVTSNITLYAKWTEAAPEPVTGHNYYLVVGTAGNYSVATNVVLTEKDSAYTLKVDGNSIAGTTRDMGQAGTAYNFKDALGAGKDIDCIFVAMGGNINGYDDKGVSFFFVTGTTLQGVNVPQGYALEFGNPVTANDYYLVIGNAGNYSLATNVVLTEKDGAYSLKVSGQSITPTTIPNADGQGGTAYNFKDALGAGKDIDCIFTAIDGMLRGDSQSGLAVVFVKTLDGVTVPNGYSLDYEVPVAANDYYLVIGTAGNYSLAINVVLTEKDGAYSLKVSGQSITATTTPNADGQGGTAYNFKDALGAGKDLDGIIMSMGGVLQGYGMSGLAFVFVKTLDGVTVPNGYTLEYTVPVAANDYYLVVGTAGNYSLATNVVLTEKDGAYSLKVSGQSITPTTQNVPGAGTAYNFKDALGAGKDIDCIFTAMGGILRGDSQSGLAFVFVKTLDGVQVPNGYSLEYTAQTEG